MMILTLGIRDHSEHSKILILKTEMGTMHGSYQMVNNQGESLEVEIPCFTLSVPGILN